jgi:DNA-directed RNA polymerase sigma subunit (sigma70/sigma32)
VSIDAMGDALGASAVDATQIDAILTALEGAGRKVDAPSGAHGIAALRKVVPAAKEIAKEQGRTARVPEIAERSGLSEDEVRRALLLARVMGR